MIKRVVEEKDADCCDALLTKLIKSEKQYDVFINDNLEVNNYFKNVITNTDNILLGYYYNDSIIGYIFLKYIFEDNHSGYLIDGLYVEENYRNQKIATRLIEEGLRLVSESNVEFIDINVLFKNEIAKKIYKSFGFDEFKINMRKYI